MLIPMRTRPSSPCGEAKVNLLDRVRRCASVQTSKRGLPAAVRTATFIKPLRRMDSTSGHSPAIIVSIIRLLHATSRLTWSDTRTWTNTGTGGTPQNMQTCGCLAGLPSAGLLIATATGFGLIHGDGPGLKTSHGATLRSTTDAGCTTTTTGDGLRDRSMFVRTIRQRWSRGLVARVGAPALDLASATAGESDGAR